MDPNATMTALNEAIAENDLDAAKEHARALLRWITRGGFLPNGWQAETLMRHLRRTITRDSLS